MPAIFNFLILLRFTFSVEWFSCETEFETPPELEVFRFFAGGASIVSSENDDIYCTHQTKYRLSL